MLASNIRARPGSLHALADGRLGTGRARRRGPRRAQPAAPGRASRSRSPARPRRSRPPRRSWRSTLGRLGAQSQPCRLRLGSARPCRSTSTDMRRQLLFGLAFGTGAGTDARPDAVAWRSVGRRRSREPAPHPGAQPRAVRGRHRRPGRPAGGAARRGGGGAVIGDSHTGGAAPDRSRRPARARPPRPAPGCARHRARSSFLSSAPEQRRRLRRRARGRPASELYSAWAAIGLAAAGAQPARVQPRRAYGLDSLRSVKPPSLEGAGDLERTILALRACGASAKLVRPAATRSRGCCCAPERRRLLRRPGQPDAFAILALRAAGLLAGESAGRGAARLARAPAGSRRRLRLRARPAWRSDVDDTAAVVQALASRGLLARARAIIRATATSSRAQNLDGGFPAAAGRRIERPVDRLGGAGPHGGRPRRLDAQPQRQPLARSATWRACVAPDGSVRYSRTGAQTPVWVTAQALTALAARPFPIAPSSRSAGV